MAEERDDSLAKNPDWVRISRQFKKHKGITDKGLASQWQRTRDCQAFYAGDFMNYSDQIQFNDLRGRSTRSQRVQFNKVRPYVDAVKGFMAQNRRKATYEARVENDKLQAFYSDYSNALSDYIRENSNADQIETQQDGDMLINGYGAVQTAMTYGEGHSTRNPNGEVIVARLEPTNVGWDPTARAPGLTDSRWVYYWQTYGKDDAVALFDVDPDRLQSVQTNEVGNRIPFIQGGGYDKIQEVFDFEDIDEEIVKIFFYEWYEIETYYRAINPRSYIKDPNMLAFIDMRMQEIALEENDQDDYDDVNTDPFAFDPRAEILTCNDKVKKQLEELFGEVVPIEFDRFRRRCYYTAVVSGNYVFNVFKSASQSGFSIKFKTGSYDERNKVWIGMVSSLKEPVLYYNKALTELMFVIASGAKGGVMAERSAIDDINEFEANYAKSDSVVVVNDGALVSGAIKPKREAFNTGGLDQILSIADANIPEVIGIDKSFLGSSESKLETAQLQRQRIRQVTTTLAVYFDSITLYQKEQARLMLDYMRVYVANNDGSLFRGRAPDGKQMYLKISQAALTGDYDVVVTEGPDTATHKEEKAAFLSTMGDKFLQIGDVETAKKLYGISVNYMPLEPQDVAELNQLFNPEQQQIDPAYVKQLEQQLQNVMNEINQADVKEKLSRAGLNMAKIEETIANIRNKNVDSLKKQTEAKQNDVETRLLQNGSSQVRSVV